MFAGEEVDGGPPGRAVDATPGHRLATGANADLPDGHTIHFGLSTESRHIYPIGGGASYILQGVGHTGYQFTSEDTEYSVDQIVPSL